jgi:alpha-beta hydrolase superfamily lysophospholipase
MDSGLSARRAGGPPGRSAAEHEADLTAAVRRMTHASPHLTSMAGGSDEVDRLLDGIENVWLDADGVPIHLDLHRAEQPRATVVFQPGSGSHARFYFLAAGLLARHGYHVLAVDRPGHGLSGGPRGDCTVEEAIAVTDTVIAHARVQWSLPVVLMGSSLGGLLTMFGLLRGLTPDLAVAHNFLQPGKLVSMRLRSRWIRRRRTRPYPLVELVHGFENLSGDPAVRAYLERRDDPGAAWELSARSVASLFGFTSTAPGTAPRSLVLNGERDKAIPAWATRLFTRWSGLPSTEVVVVADAGHLLFHDHLDTTLPIVTTWLDAHL